MLSATDVPTVEERERALAMVPWKLRSQQLAGKTHGLLRDSSADLIDMAVGTIHARAALVALHEGADNVFQAGMDLVDSAIAEQALSRIDPRHPLGKGELLSPPEDPRRLVKRAVRARLEDAAIRVAVAGNHFVNAHLRLAWEANAATKEEVVACGFNPTSNAFRNWADVDSMIRGLRKVAGEPLPSLPRFALQSAFDAYVSNDDVTATRHLRHRIVHRGRPSYKDAPAIGRTSLWTGGPVEVTFPAPTGHARTDDPSLADVCHQVSRACEATVDYGDAIWELALRWLRTVDIDVDWIPGQVKVSVPLSLAGPRHPRERRDPGPFVA